MPDHSSQPLSRKFLGAILAGLMTTLFGGVAVMYYLGMFNRVEVRPIDAPPYRIAYLYHVGPYNDIAASIDKARDYLQRAGIKADTACALLLDDTGSTPEPKRRAKVGYLVDEHAIIPPQLEEERLHGRKALAVSFSGGKLLGSYKAYEAMKQWAKAHHYELLLPALEIYRADGVVEYQLGIRKHSS